MEEINPKYPTFTGEDKEKAEEIADKLRNKEI